jgi:hypothetical protein
VCAALCGSVLRASGCVVVAVVVVGGVVAVIAGGGVKGIQQRSNRLVRCLDKGLTFVSIPNGNHREEAADVVYVCVCVSSSFLISSAPTH